MGRWWRNGALLMSKLQIMSCKWGWIGPAVEEVPIAARFNRARPALGPIPWGPTPRMPSTITIRSSSTGGPLATSILLPSPLLSTPVSIHFFHNPQIIFWHNVCRAYMIWIQFAGHESCHYEFAPWSERLVNLQLPISHCSIHELFLVLYVNSTES